MIASALIRFRHPMCLLGVLLGMLCLPFSNRLTLDREITSMFSSNDPVLVQYQQLQESFGGNVVAMLVYRDDDLLTVAGIQRNDDLTSQVAKLPGVRGVLSPARLNRLVSQIRPAAPMQGDSRLPPLADANDALASGFLDLFSGYTHSADGTRAAVVAILEPDHPASTIEALQRIAESTPLPIKQAVLVGEPVLVNDGFDLIRRDGAKLATWTIALLSMVIVVTLRSIRFTLLVVVCIAWSVIVTRAAMVGVGVQLSIVSSILTAIVSVIVVAGVLHLGVRYRQLESESTDRLWMARHTLSYLWVPITWTCLTDAAGFLALLASSIRPVREFGGMIGFAAVASLASIAVFAPVLLGFGGRVGVRRADQNAEPTWLTGVVRASIRRRRWVVGVAALTGVASAMGVGRAETETSFLKNFRDDSRIVASYGEVEANLGGAGIWDVVLSAPPILSSEYMDSVRALEVKLRDFRVDGQSLSKVISMADAEQIASTVPLLAIGPPDLRMAAMRTVLPVFADALLTPMTDQAVSVKQPRRLRIMLRSREQLETDTKERLIAGIRAIVRAHIATVEWSNHFPQSIDEESTGWSTSANVTGYYVMLASLVGRLLADQWICFAFSYALVFTLLFWMSGRLSLAAMATAANGIPALFVLSMIGVFGERLNLGAAMIAAVSIGLSIDGSVHLLHHHLRMCRDGQPWLQAIEKSAAAVGVPMVLAMVALVIGFGVLATSDFVPTATFGVLVASTLVIGTAVNLTVLPAMMSMLTPKSVR